MQQIPPTIALPPSRLSHKAVKRKAAKKDRWTWAKDLREWTATAKVAAASRSCIPEVHAKQ